MKCRNCEITYDDRLDVCPLCDTPSAKNEAADVPRENAHPHEHRCSNCDHVFFGKDLHECPKCHSFLREPVAMETTELFTKDKEYITKEQREKIKDEKEKRKQEEEEAEICAHIDKEAKLCGILRTFCKVSTIVVLPLIAVLSWMACGGNMIGTILSFIVLVPIAYLIFYCMSLCILAICNRTKRPKDANHTDYQAEIYRSVKELMIDNHNQR